MSLLKTDSKKGFKVELCTNVDLMNFRIDKISKDSFMRVAKPIEVIRVIKYYGKDHKLTENQLKVITILERNHLLTA